MSFEEVKRQLDAMKTEAEQQMAAMYDMLNRYHKIQVELKIERMRMDILAKSRGRGRNHGDQIHDSDTGSCVGGTPGRSLYEVFNRDPDSDD